MDAIEVSGDFQGWELLQENSDAEAEKFFPEIDSDGLIQTNYFSSEPQNSYGDYEKLVVSENPSWIDPEMEEAPIRYIHKESGEFWSDSSSERSENCEFSTLAGGNKVGFPEIEKIDFISGCVEESTEKNLGCLDMDSAGIEKDLVDSEVKQSLHPDPETLSEGVNDCKAENQIEEYVNEKPNDNKESLVWWKMPIEFLKYCVFKMSPVWTVSFAAAVMGFVILGRRLYRMRNKARTLELKVAVDDKKVSQVMSQAARLNEAFSIVKRVPAIRPSLHAVGSSAWSVISLR